MFLEYITIKTMDKKELVLLAMYLCKQNVWEITKKWYD